MSRIGWCLLQSNCSLKPDLFGLPERTDTEKEEGRAQKRTRCLAQSTRRAEKGNGGRKGSESNQFYLHLSPLNMPICTSVSPSAHFSRAAAMLEEEPLS